MLDVTRSVVVEFFNALTKASGMVVQIRNKSSNLQMNSSALHYEFSDIYEYIDIVEKHIGDSTTFFELSFEEDSKLVMALQKPNRLSVLHHYIYRTIYVYYSRYYRKESDCIEVEEANRIIDNMNRHGIETTPYPAIENVTQDHDMFSLWFQKNRKMFEYHWELITDEIFHLVFANRRFLQRFNISLSEYLKENSKLLPPEITTKSGKIKRFSRLPEWLKKAVFFRDGGCCVFCGTDLSGLLKINSKLNFDHIVPLAKFGTNDPSNFQLLCRECNSDKLDRNRDVGQLYTPWWKYVET